MPPLTQVVAELHRLAQPLASDADLLDRFVRRRDEAAFAVLVERHGPMVLRVCRRLLGDAHTAEDALQATFLVLARKAAMLPRPAGLASWLYAVAQRIAFKARRTDRRLRRCTANAERPDPSGDPLSALTARELLVVLEEELQRLPATYRMAVVACCLEGHGRDEAAALLGCSTGALRGWLERGRARLHARLVKRGVTLTAALAAAEAARSSVDAAMLTSAAAAALGTASATVVRLAGSSALGRLPLVLLAALVLGGAALWLMPTAEPAPNEPQTVAPAPPPAAQAPQPASAHADARGEPLPPEAVARIGSTRLRHAGHVNTVAYTPDGKSIVSLDEDGHLCFWDAATGENQRRWRPSKRSYEGQFALHRDGKTIVLFDGYLGQSLDMQTGKPLQSFRQDSQGFALYPSFDPAGKVLAIHTSNILRVIDMETGKERFRTPVDAELIGSAAVSPDCKTVAVSVANGATVLLVDAMTGKLQRRLDGPEGSAGSLAFSRDGKLLFSGQGTPVIWDLATAKVVGQVKNYLNLLCAAFSPDGKRIALGGREHVLIAEIPSGKELRRLPAYGTMCLTFAADGRTLLAGGWDGEISQWDVTTGRLLEASANPFPQVHRLQFLDERRLQFQARTFEVWDWRAATVLKRLPEFDRDQVGLPDVSRDGRWLAYPARSDIILIDTQAGGAQRRLKGPRTHWGTLRFAADGRTLFATAWDNVVRGWDVATGDLRHEWKYPGERVHHTLAVSPDGQWVVTGPMYRSQKPDATFRVWDVRANRLAHAIAQDGLYFKAFAFSPDSKMLAAAGGSAGEFGLFDPNTPGQIVVFDTASARPIVTITGHPRPVGHVTFSPDGRSLATADYNFEKKIAFRYWEIATQRERHRFEGHIGRVHALAFSPSGALLAAASPDAPAYVWDVYGRHGAKSPMPESWSAKERDQLWEALGHADAAVGFKTVRQMIHAPTVAVALVRDRLKQAAPVQPKRVKQWLAELDSADFAERQTASAELENLGDRVEAPLREALAAQRSVEAKRRIETLLARIAAPTPDNLRRGRALEALEQIATPDALRLLDTLAAGEPSARLTREAAAACARLKRVAADKR